MRSLQPPELTLIQSSKHPSYQWPLLLPDQGAQSHVAAMSPESCRGPEVRLGHSKAVLPTMPVPMAAYFSLKKVLDKASHSPG